MGFVVVGTLFAAALSAGFGRAAMASPPLLSGQFYGGANAVEAEAMVASLSVGLGSASAAACPCSGSNGHTVADTVSTLSVGPGGSLVSATTNRSTAYGLKTATTATTFQTTTISNLNVLGGLITADVIKAAARVDATSSALTQTTAASTLTNLVIAGQPIKANVAENTVIPLPGLGSVTVKFVDTGTYGTQAIAVEVEMLRVSIDTANSLGLPVGSVLVVGEAFAGYNRVQPAASISGLAETLAVTVNAGSLLQEAAVAGATSGISTCAGTGGATVKDSVENLSAAGLLSLTTANTTAYGGPVGSSTVAKTTSSVAKISLLGGLITASGIVAAAEEVRIGNVSKAHTLNTSFGGLSVAGVAITGAVAPNTVITLPALGYVVLNEQPPASGGHIQVNGLHIIILSDNSLGLPIGAQIFVAHADATATAF